MRHSQPTHKLGKQNQPMNQPWLYYEPFDTDLAETLIKYHFEGLQKDYPKWKNRLNNTARKRCRRHLLALSRLTHWMRQELQKQYNEFDNVTEFKQQLEDPEYGEESNTTTNL